jgi:hypothetical protein
MGGFEKLKLFISLGYDHYFGQQMVTGSNILKPSLYKAFDRINHLHVTSCVIAQTPSVHPFQNGATYFPIFTKFIPRFLWPGKPVEDLGNRWAKWYGYLANRDFTTSFNLPWLTEMFLNFGWAGVICINILIGIMFCFLKPLWSHPENPEEVAFGLTLGMPLTLVESHLSMKLGSLIIGVPILFAFFLSLSFFFPRITSFQKRCRKFQ